MLSDIRPSELGGEGAGKGQCEVERGKRQQLDELEFLSGRGGWWGQVLAGPGKGKPTIGDGWTEGRSEGTGRDSHVALLDCFACLVSVYLSSVTIHHHHHHHS